MSFISISIITVTLSIITVTLYCKKIGNGNDRNGNENYIQIHQMCHVINQNGALCLFHLI